LAGSFGTRTWRGLAYLLVGLPVTAAVWALAVAAIVTGVLASVTVVGVAVVPLLLRMIRAAAALERRRCALVGRAPAGPPRLDLGDLAGRDRLRAQLSDPNSWRELGWLLLAWLVNLACAALACSLSAVALGLISMPVWYRFLPDGQAKLYDSGGVAHGVVATTPAALPWALAGLVLLWVAGWTTQGLARGQARLAAALLAPARTSRLQARIATLAATRAAAVHEQRREMHRIERDLHDGAQARLVALSADLGLAGEAFDDDPELARRLVGDARDGVVEALGELRDLVRGIGPPILTDRGLGAALEAVAARSLIPVTVAVSLPCRPPPATETAAYFVVCESLVNAAKHSRARHISVAVAEENGACVVTVADDGDGGADPGGAGLTGLASRAAAIDGTMTVDSPAGGPTIVEARLPCG
jgi:signal transduction histidine kinase